MVKRPGDTLTSFNSKKGMLNIKEETENNYFWGLIVCPHYFTEDTFVHLVVILSMLRATMNLRVHIHNHDNADKV